MARGTCRSKWYMAGSQGLFFVSWETYAPAFNIPTGHRRCTRIHL